MQSTFAAIPRGETVNAELSSASLDDLKNSACTAVDRHRQAVIDLGEQVWARPETGFKEQETARRVAAAFADAGLVCTEGLARTGLRAELSGAQPGPTLALLAEMDAIILPEHPAADPRTGAVHACGHHAQLAGLFGAVLALNQKEILDRLAGRVIFMAVPAEEYLDLDYRRELVAENKIRFLGGKQELIRLGYFNDVDLALMIHTVSGQVAQVRSSMNGFTAQYVRFSGRASHAGLSPHAGVNALNAAMVALSAVNAQRETFPEDRCVRVHSIIRRGGDSVNTVPAEVLVETMVRARTQSAIADAAKVAERCYRAGALALGAQVGIDSLPGYLPLDDCPMLAEVFRRNAECFFGPTGIKESEHIASSTDMGDVSQIVPASHPGLGGAAGSPHTAEYRIADPEMAYVTPGKVMGLCAIDLLGLDAALARRTTEKHPPNVAKNAYTALLLEQCGYETYDYHD